jgi:hypothetical protein
MSLFMLKGTHQWQSPEVSLFGWIPPDGEPGQ